MAESHRGKLIGGVVLNVAFPIGALVVRILVEERFLGRELAGYDAYTKRVRYRLIAFVW